MNSVRFQKPLLPPMRREAPRNTNPPPPPPATTHEKTPAEITAEKMAAMAADPAAIPVYWTETGPDVKGWDVIFPEFKVLNEAFKGGYGWYDLTEGQGLHLLPKRHSYKIVKISREELKVIRAREAAEEAAVAAAAEEAELAPYREAARRKEEREAAERLAATQEPERVAAQEAEKKSHFYAASATVIVEEILALTEEFLITNYVLDLIVERIRPFEMEDQNQLIARICPAIEPRILEIEAKRKMEATIQNTIDEIRALPYGVQYDSYLADFIVDRIANFSAEEQDRMIVAIVSAVEKENLIFYTPVGSPECEPVAPIAEPPPFSLDAEFPLMPHQLFAVPEDPVAFLAQPSFFMCGTTYIPALHQSNNQRMYVPIDFLKCALMPQPSPLPVSETCSDPMCVMCNKSLPLLPTPSNCNDKCSTCNPAPLPTKSLPPLSPPMPPLDSMKNIKIKKMRMPRMNRIRHLIAGL